MRPAELAVHLRPTIRHQDHHCHLIYRYLVALQNLMFLLEPQVVDLSVETRMQVQ
jgi:hypothetical protein